MHRIAVTLLLLSTAALAQDSARTVQYHQQDIVRINARVKFSTLIQLPLSEKIMEAATGDKDFWIVDVVGNSCFVHPAKSGISSDLHLITDKGNVYTFTLQAVDTAPDLKVMIEPADRSSIAASNGPSQYVPAAEVTQLRQQLKTATEHIGQEVDAYKSQYPLSLKFDYTGYRANEAPFNVQSIYHDDRFTYIKSDATEKFVLYDEKDGKPNLVTYDLRAGTYVVPIVMDSGYLQIGKKRMDFKREVK